MNVVLDLPEHTYHAHPALSVSGAKKLLPPSTPALFRYEQEHPPPPKDVFDFGTCAHAILLGAGPPVVAVDAPDWRGKAARDRREQIRVDGGVPILAGDYDTAQAMAASVRAHPTAGKLFADGTPEVSLFWTDGNVERRARVDWLREDCLVDLKTTVCAEPGEFARSCARFRYDMQHAWYLDGAAVLDLPDRFLFVAVEKSPPYLVSVVELDEDSIAAGHARNRAALDVYEACSAFDSWPGYADGVQTIRLPEWALR